MEALICPERRSILPSRFCYRQRLPPFPPVAEPLGGGAVGFGSNYYFGNMHSHVSSPSSAHQAAHVSNWTKYMKSVLTRIGS